MWQCYCGAPRNYGTKKFTSDSQSCRWIVGEGSFGAVLMVEVKNRKERYALKILRKKHVEKTGTTRSIQVPLH